MNHLLHASPPVPLPLPRPLPQPAPPQPPVVLPLELPGCAGMLLLSPQPGLAATALQAGGWEHLGGQIARALAALGTLPEAGGPPGPAAAPATAEVRYYPSDASVFVDGEYLIKGVAGAIFWKLVRAHAEHGRGDFTTRELRLAGGELRLPDVQDNLDVRLLLLRRRLEQRGGPVRIEKTGRGRFRLVVTGALRLSSAAGN